jgi:hypothetical protein
MSTEHQPQTDDIDVIKMRDDSAVIQFAEAMRLKMDISRAKGRNGWPTVSVHDLWLMLRGHVEKGDPIDVANLAMMIWHNSKKGPST